MVLALVVAILIKTFLVQAFYIPSTSMVPTLLKGDRILVCRICYRVGDIQRGDVIVFADPTPEPSEPGPLRALAHWLAEGVGVARPAQDDFIKRVIGLPGDRIQVRQGLLYVNDVPVERQRIEDYVDPDRPGTRPVPQYLETLPGGVTHRIIEQQGDTASDSDNTQVYVVPADHYFMMGDNRDGSNDSRALSAANFIASVKVGDAQGMELAEAAFAERCQKGTIDDSNKECLGTVGFVPKENLIGPAKILFWSYGSSFRWYNPVTWATALRVGRLLNVIQ